MAFSELLKKASGVLHNFGIGDGAFLGKDGDIVYSKNNVCVHPPSTESGGEELHSPGYLSIHCQSDDVLGVTLVMQWLPNATLERNPRSIRTISPRMANAAEKDSRARIKLRHLHGRSGKRRDSTSSDSSGSVHETPVDTTTPAGSETEAESTSNTAAMDAPDEPVISVEMNGDQLTVTATPPDRPFSLPTEEGLSLGVPSISVIPHTPVAPGGGDELDGGSSGRTSGADDDEASDGGSNADDAHSSPYTSGDEAAASAPTTPCGALEPSSSILLRYRDSDLITTSPEQFAQSHNLMLPDGIRPSGGDSAVDLDLNRAHFHKAATASLFSVDLGKMRSLRLFFSDSSCSSGQLVVASYESQYKILHFHRGGLDKLAQILEQWNAVRARSVKDGSPSAVPDRHFAICRPDLAKSDLDPEEGLYERVSWDFWRASTNADGAIDDSLTIRKAVFFAGVEQSLRKEAWPFLLHVYPFNSTREQRETLRNDHFLDYQSLRKKRMKEATEASTLWLNVDHAISKDVVRTDRNNPYYKGDGNPNVDMMKSILMNYAALCPQIGYIQGMSDLLAPILATLQNEADAFWCFAGLMRRTIFVSGPNNCHNMDLNLEYLRELLKLLQPDFFRYLASLGGEALGLLFTHRWLLLCFKREFADEDALRVWEACWAEHRTAHLHLFVCVAIVGAYGADALGQRLAHDELLLYFAALAMHMRPADVLRKARGLLYHFYRMERIPCTLAALCKWQSAAESDPWEAACQPRVDCVQVHGDHEPCPFAT